MKRTTLALAVIGGLWMVPAALAQAPGAAKPKDAKAAAYYHAAVGHLYSELAEQYGGRAEYVTKAIDNFKQAMKFDPESGALAQELADLYIQSGQIRTAVNEFEELVKKSPDDLNARRILGRLYMARIRDTHQTRLNDDMLKQAIAQYEKVSEKAPQDLDNWVLLGRLHKMAQSLSASEKAYKKALEIAPENEDALTGLAMVYSDLGDTTSASAMLKKVAERNPSLRTLTALAATYEQMKDFKQTAETYRRALELNKENTDLKRAYAQALFQAEDYDKAKDVFLELASEDPNDLLATLRLSQLFRQKRDYEKAAHYARRAKELDPNNLEIQYNEVTLLETQGKTAEAVARLKEILAAMPAKADSVAERGNRIILLERLGLLYRQSEQTTEAVAAFREIAELDPQTSSRALAQIIDALRAGKDYASAEREAKAALQKFPNDRLVKTLAANVWTDLGRFREAETALKSLMDGKGDREVWLSLAQVYDKNKNFAEMAKALDQAEKLTTEDDDKENIHFLRGAMFERQKKFDQAEEEFRKVLKLNPQSASAMNYLGYMLADRNTRLSEALDLIKKAVDLEPANSAFLDSLGWAYFRMNQLEEAASSLVRSLERGSRDPTVHDHLGDVYNGQNKLKDAIVQWEKALTEWKTNAPSDVDAEEVAKIQKKLESARVRQARESGAKKN